jgi:TolB-like protein
MGQATDTVVTSPPDDVRAQLERILASQVLAGSDQLKRFLRAVVERTLDGRADLLKEYNLGLEVFHRPPDYDPKLDPIVRVQARRLRSKLEEYYAREGAHDPVLIQIPKGAYVPVFETNAAGAQPASGVERDGRAPDRRIVWIAAMIIAVVGIVVAALRFQSGGAGPADIDHSVAVLPLKMFSAGGERGYIADEITEVLTTQLAKNKQIRVLSRTTASGYRDTKTPLPEVARALRVRWVVEGGVGVQGDRVYIKLRTVDSSTDRKVWADGLDCDQKELVPTATRAAGQIATAIVDRIAAAKP